MDAFAFEKQFLDHLAPVWRLLPPSHRGRIYVEEDLVERARLRGIVDAVAVNGGAIRSGSRDPGPRPGGGPMAFVASIGDTKIARRMGYRRFAFIEHGAGQSYNGDRSVGGRNPSYAGGDDREDVEVALVPNEYSRSAWVGRYPDVRAVVVGDPLVVDLPAREPGPGPVVALSFHWPAYTSPEAGTAVAHYLRELPALGRAFRTIGHAHPRWAAMHPGRTDRWYRGNGITPVAEFADVCRQADVYVCDNSSSMFEFAATGRPVVVLNTPQYRRNVHHGGRFWDWATVGIQVDRPEDLVPAVRRALEDPPEVRAERERVLDLVYPVDPATGSRVAADALAAWDGGLEAAA